MKKLAITLLPVAASLIVVSGCGGKSRNTAYANSVRDYAAALSSICRPAVKQVQALNTSSPSEFVQQGPKIKDAIHKAVERMDRLKPPDRVKDAAEDLISKSRQEEDKIDELVDAAKKGDLAKLQKVSSEISALDRATNKDAREIGARACITGG